MTWTDRSMICQACWEMSTAWTAVRCRSACVCLFLDEICCIYGLCPHIISNWQVDETETCTHWEGFTVMGYPCGNVWCSIGITIWALTVFCRNILILTFSRSLQGDMRKGLYVFSNVVLTFFRLMKWVSSLQCAMFANCRKCEICRVKCSYPCLLKAHTGSGWTYIDLYFRSETLNWSVCWNNVLSLHGNENRRTWNFYR